jgi:hypothetical protein
MSHHEKKGSMAAKKASSATKSDGAKTAAKKGTTKRK